MFVVLLIVFAVICVVENMSHFDVDVLLKWQHVSTLLQWRAVEHYGNLSTDISSKAILCCRFQCDLVEILASYMTLVQISVDQMSVSKCLFIKIMCCHVVVMANVCRSGAIMSCRCCCCCCYTNGTITIKSKKKFSTKVKKLFYFL